MVLCSGQPLRHGLTLTRQWAQLWVIYRVIRWNTSVPGRNGLGPKFIQLGSEMVGINLSCSVFFSPNLCHIIDLQIRFLGSLQVSSHVQPMPSCSMAWSFRLPEVSFYLRCLESPSTKVSLRGSSKIETPSSGADTCASATQRGRCCHFASNLGCDTWSLWMWWDLKGHLWVKMYTGPQVHNGPQI